MELTLLVGAKRIGIIIDEHSQVNNLMEIVAEQTKIKKINQKLIFKGVSLTTQPDRLLSEFGIKSGSKVMVVGKRYDSEEEAALSTFNGIAKAVTTLSKETDGLEKQTKSIKDGFLQKKYQLEAFEKIKTDLNKISHTLMKNLETIDSMPLSTEFKDAKTKRKVVVDEVQKLMDRCDAITESLESS